MHSTHPARHHTHRNKQVSAIRFYVFRRRARATERPGYTLNTHISSSAGTDEAVIGAGYRNERGARGKTCQSSRGGNCLHECFLCSAVLHTATYLALHTT